MGIRFVIRGSELSEVVTEFQSQRAGSAFFNKTGLLPKKMIIQDLPILPFHYEYFNKGHFQNDEQ